MSSGSGGGQARRRSLLRWVLIIIGVVALGAVTWHKVIRHQVIPKNFGVVEAGQIYRSGQLSERMLRRMIEQHEIRSVIALNATDEEGVMEERVCAELGVERHVFNLRGDGTGKPQHYVEVLRLMADADKDQPILIHCAAGAQRTSAAVVLYRSIVQGMSIEEAYPESFDYNHEPDEWKLLAYIAEHRDEIEAGFRQDGSLD